MLGTVLPKVRALPAGHCPPCSACAPAASRSSLLSHAPPPSRHSFLSDGTNDKIQEVINSGVCRRLVELLL